MALGYAILNHRGNVIKIQIRQKTSMKSQEKYLQELKQWLHDTSDSPLEEMSDFFQSGWMVMNPGIEVTGVDLCQSMLDKLLEKHSDKHLITVCQDYFQYNLGYGKWDAIISFESLHHFLPERKGELYRKIYNGLKKGGVFLLGDYIACCDEEEKLLRNVYLKKRKQSLIPDNHFVHFDIPLTLEHESKLLQDAGFIIAKVLNDPDGVTIITAEKGD